jgi:hypothetical protein
MIQDRQYFAFKPILGDESLMLSGALVDADHGAPPRQVHHNIIQHQQQHHQRISVHHEACHLFTSTPSRSKKGQGQRHRMTPNDVQDALTTFPSLAAGASQITSFIARNDPLKYAFMFPIVTGVAITCQLAGIGGAVA